MATTVRFCKSQMKKRGQEDNNDCVSVKKQKKVAPIKLMNGDPYREATANLWRERLFCDIEITVEGCKFPAHRFVLASYSDYMKTLCRGNRFSDSDSESIELKDMASGAFESILTWMYTGQCEIDRASLSKTLEAATFLQCTRFLHDILEASSKSLDSSTCLSAWEMGEKLNLPSLIEAAKTKAKSCFAEVVNLDEFNSLPLDRLVVLISSNEINVSKEEQVFDSVVRWAKAQQCPPTDAELGEIFSHVRFPLMNNKFLKNKVETEELLLSTPHGLLCFGRSFREAYSEEVAPRIRGQLTWEELHVGMRVQIESDVASVKGLCEKPVPGSIAGRIGWAPSMSGYVGKEGKVVKLWPVLSGATIDTGGRYTWPCAALKRAREMDGNQAPMSFKEKRSLAESIRRLAPDKLTRVAQIIQESIPFEDRADDNEIEIDIDSLDPPTLRKLELYVLPQKK